MPTKARAYKYLPDKRYTIETSITTGHKVLAGWEKDKKCVLNITELTFAHEFALQSCLSNLFLTIPITRFQTRSFSRSPSLNIPIDLKFQLFGCTYIDKFMTAPSNKIFRAFLHSTGTRRSKKSSDIRGLCTFSPVTVGSLSNWTSLTFIMIPSLTVYIICTCEHRHQFTKEVPCFMAQNKMVDTYYQN